MKVIDISWPITPDMTTYRDTQDITFTSTHTFERDNMRRSRIVLSSHMATHVDAPAHFIQNGKTVDQISLAQLIGTCAVLDLTDVEDSITRYDLEQFELPKGLIVLFKTRNSELLEDAPFESKFIYLESDAAQYCVEMGFKAIGIDYLGIERNQAGHETHKALLGNNIPIIEGLRLAHVHEGTYFFICLPISLIGLDAAPARAILIEDLV